MYYRRKVSTFDGIRLHFSQFKANCRGFMLLSWSIGLVLNDNHPLQQDFEEERMGGMYVTSQPDFCPASLQVEVIELGGVLLVITEECVGILVSRGY